MRFESPSTSHEPGAHPSAPDPGHHRASRGATAEFVDEPGRRRGALVDEPRRGARQRTPNRVYALAPRSAGSWNARVSSRA